MLNTSSLIPTILIHANQNKIESLAKGRYKTLPNKMEVFVRNISLSVLEWIFDNADCDKVLIPDRKFVIVKGDVLNLKSLRCFFNIAILLVVLIFHGKEQHFIYLQLPTP